MCMNPRECNTAEELGAALPLKCHAFWEVGVKIDSQISEIYNCVGKHAQIREAGKGSHANCVNKWQDGWEATMVYF